jgi:Ca2+-binding RTX toxin-like protein
MSLVACRSWLVARLIVVACGSFIFQSAAHAAWGNCASGDAPAGSTGAQCQAVCTESGSEVSCELDKICTTGANAWIVQGFGVSTHDLSAWGNCGATAFCCVYDEGATNIDTVELNGVDQSGGNDDLAFFFTSGGVERNLQPWDSDPITGIIRGNQGADSILGSNYAGTDYDDVLYGQVGADTMDGQDGADVCDGGDGADIILGGDGPDHLKGGKGDDELYGEVGNDTEWGGDGDDLLDGGGNNDVLCDTTGITVCASSQGNKFLGDQGDDKIWYVELTGTGCGAIIMDSTSSGGTGTDSSGRTDDFSSSDLGTNMESFTNVEPAKCEDQN